MTGQRVANVPSPLVGSRIAGKYACPYSGNVLSQCPAPGIIPEALPEGVVFPK